MAILQVSRITHRKGLQENLPQLAGAELGWSLDTRQLYIGNGTLADGAPVIGNTEILTEFSDILALSSSYTYKGERAGYVVSTADSSEDDVVRSLQSRFDEIVSVLSFGAYGDNTTDDTDAINRALYELFCRQANTEIRRALFFPAGIYRVSDTIKIPPHAKLFGEGIMSSIIEYHETGNGADMVVTTSDSNHQIGVAIGNGGATTPTGVEIYHMGIHSETANDLLLLDSIEIASFGFMHFQGPLTSGDITSETDYTAAIRVVNSTGVIVSSDITFNKCVTTGTTYGLDVVDSCYGLQFENGKMDYHYKGVLIGHHDDTYATVTWPGTDIKGINVTRTIFDHIAQEGIHIGPLGGRTSVLDPLTIMCSSAFNVFYDVGNDLGITPAAPCINFENETHVSIGDLFERDDDDNLDYPRIEINNTPCIAFDATHAIKLGVYQRETGLQSEISSGSSGTLFTIQSTDTATFDVDYVITYNALDSSPVQMRNGHVRVINDLTTVEYDDEYIESGDTAIPITLTPTMDGTNTDFDYNASSCVYDVTVNFSIVRLDIR